MRTLREDHCNIVQLQLPLQSLLLYQPGYSMHLRRVTGGWNRKTPCHILNQVRQGVALYCGNVSLTDLWPSRFFALSIE